ncbi:helix-turn-helix transcriptional regulator [Clostridium rectalis]|uniref:helix-turn-helix transcriptional regulator n=1 Tax=Clostridium rectalis TaxID=2040295 RepID=UPI000F637611|nr:helix-turn-helix transcriptional regulator [Clostridium rectalis]
MKKYEMLKAYRILNGLTQKEMGEIIELSRSSYNRRENGKIPFSLEEAKIIANEFNLTIEEIFL